jgi:outer membrane murein-binding lipoprotein Lpp
MTKEEFRNQAKSNIDLLVNKIDQLETKGENISHQMKLELERKQKMLKDQQKELFSKYKQLEQTTNETWNDAKASFNESYQLMKTKIDQAIEQVS